MKPKKEYNRAVLRDDAYYCQLLDALIGGNTGTVSENRSKRKLQYD